VIELEAIKKRYEAATPGPWRAGYLGVDGWHDGEGHEIMGDSTESIVCGNYDCDLGGVIESKDAAFIAHAREDIPALVAELTKVREALEILAKMEGYSLDCLEADAEPRVAIR